MFLLLINNVFNLVIKHILLFNMWIFNTLQVKINWFLRKIFQDGILVIIYFIFFIRFVSLHNITFLAFWTIFRLQCLYDTVETVRCKCSWMATVDHKWLKVFQSSSIFDINLHLLLLFASPGLILLISLIDSQRC